MAPKKKAAQKADKAAGQQSPASRTRGLRRPQNGDSNGKGLRRTAAQLERQEKCFTLSVLYGKTIRAIAAELHIDQKTVIADIRAEEQRRADEIAHRRENEKARAVAFYDGVIAKAQSKSDRYDALLGEPGVKITDHTLEAMLKARERQDKILGIDAPTKVELGLQKLVEALAGGGDDRNAQLE